MARYLRRLLVWPAGSLDGFTILPTQVLLAQMTRIHSVAVSIDVCYDLQALDDLELAYEYFADGVKRNWNGQRRWELHLRR